MSEVTFLPDMAEYAVVTEAQTELTHAGQDDRKLANWTRKYGQAAVDRCNELTDWGDGEP